MTRPERWATMPRGLRFSALALLDLSAFADGYLTPHWGWRLPEERRAPEDPRLKALRRFREQANKDIAKALVEQYGPDAVEAMTCRGDT